MTTTFRVVVVFLLFTASCGKDKKDVVEVVFDPETTYTMRTTDIQSLISDSGLTRYRLKAKEMMVFEKAEEPFWYFPRGIYIEKFDTLFNIEASFEADTAYHWDKKGLWKAIGNVNILNLEGERFETELLYWDSNEERIYSDAFIRIEQHDKTITGIGFESDQNMTNYRIFRPQGSIPVGDAMSPDTTAQRSKEPPAVTPPVTTTTSRVKPDIPTEEEELPPEETEQV